MDIVCRLKAINIDYKKDSFDLKQKKCQFNEIIKIQNNIEIPLTKIKHRQKQIPLNQELHNYYQRTENYDFESYLIKNSLYILFDQ